MTNLKKKEPKTMALLMNNVNVKNNHPLFVGICGAPGAGKTTFQEAMSEYGALPIDDGRVLRDIAIRMFGLIESDVSTQEGKMRSVEVCDKVWQVRQILGQVGNHLEQLFGDQILAEIAIRDALDDFQIRSFSTVYTFGSVRKNQGLTYKKNDGVIIEVVRDGYVPVNDFDYYNKSLVDIVIDNNGTPVDLQRRAQQVLSFTQSKVGVNRV